MCSGIRFSGRPHAIQAFSLMPALMSNFGIIWGRIFWHTLIGGLCAQLQAVV
jgi:hypothetical protein